MCRVDECGGALGAAAGAHRTALREIFAQGWAASHSARDHAVHLHPAKLVRRDRSDGVKDAVCKYNDVLVSWNRTLL